MLNKPIEEIIVQNGKVIGVKSEGEVSSFYNLKNTVFLWRKCFPMSHGMGIDAGFRSVGFVSGKLVFVMSKD